MLLAERGKAPTALDLNNDLESIMTTSNLFHVRRRKGEKTSIEASTTNSNWVRTRVRRLSKSGGMKLWTFSGLRCRLWFCFPKFSPCDLPCDWERRGETSPAQGVKSSPHDNWSVLIGWVASWRWFFGGGASSPEGGLSVGVHFG